MSLLKTHKFLLLQIGLILTLVIFLSININRPLVDYDEALYAKVTVDTVKTGDIMTLSLAGASWYDKPPLYFWIAIACVKLFGTSEFVFRLPSILFSILSIWLTFLITKELTKNDWASLSASLILLFSPAFFVFASEARLDSGVVFSIMLTLWCFVKSWQNNKFLFWFFPAIALGFLAKSVIIFLVFPIILIYSLFYKNYSWIKDKYFWSGSLVSLVILLPWHILQYVRFGNDFINSYFLYHVVQRVTSTITGQNAWYDYLVILWQYYNPWIWILFALSVISVAIHFKKVAISLFPWREIFAPLFSVIGIIVLFTIARTHLSTYIMPAFPFLAMFIALFGYNLCSIFPKQKYLFISIFILSLIIAPFNSLNATKEVVSDFHYEEREVGQIYAKAENNTKPFYVLGWPSVETISYYGRVHAEYIDPNSASSKVIKGPFYIAIPLHAIGFFYKNRETPVIGYENLKILYLGQSIVLFYSDTDERLP